MNRERFDEIMARIRVRHAEGQARAAALPAPRYDDVFREGLAWLDSCDREEGLTMERKGNVFAPPDSLAFFVDNPPDLDAVTAADIPKLVECVRVLLSQRGCDWSTMAALGEEREKLLDALRRVQALRRHTGIVDDVLAEYDE